MVAKYSGMWLGRTMIVPLICWFAQQSVCEGVAEFIVQGLGGESTESHPLPISETKPAPYQSVISEPKIYSLSPGAKSKRKSPSLEATATRASTTLTQPSRSVDRSVSNDNSIFSTFSTRFNGSQAIASDQCDADWAAYWDALQSLESVSDLGKTTVTTIDTYTGRAASTQIVVNQATTVTWYAMNGAFTISPTSTGTETLWTWIYTRNAITGHTRTDTMTLDVQPSDLISMPHCSQPAIIPACQSSWERYITMMLRPSPSIPLHCNVFQTDKDHALPCELAYSSSQDNYERSQQDVVEPMCSAYSISGQLCQSVRDQWQTADDWSFAPDYWQLAMDLNIKASAVFQSHGSLALGPGIDMNKADYWTWLTSSTLGTASGCTLGCGRCEVSGGTVQLFYWPTQHQATASGTSRNATRGAAKVTRLSTVEISGTTLTSPTLYVSFAGLSAANACHGIGSAIPATIIPIPTDMRLSSIYGMRSACHPKQRTRVTTLTAPFDIADLEEPIPFSVYRKEPSCQSELSCAGQGTCLSPSAYNPILVLPHKLYQQLQPAWSDCWADVHGVYDPPQALTAVPEAESITALTAMTRPPAAPSQQIDHGLTTPTSVQTSAFEPHQTWGPVPPQHDASHVMVVISTKTLVVGLASWIETIIQGQTPSAGQLLSADDPGSTSDPHLQPAAMIGAKSLLSAQNQEESAKIPDGSAKPLSITTLIPFGNHPLSTDSAGVAMLGSLSSTGILTTITVGSQVITVKQGTAGTILVAGGTSTEIRIGAVATFGDQQLSAGLSGILVIGTGMQASSVFIPPVSQVGISSQRAAYTSMAQTLPVEFLNVGVFIAILIALLM